MLLSYFPAPLVPDQASTIGWHIDAIAITLVSLATFFAIAVTLPLIYFAIKYRKGSPADRSNPIHGHLALELTWMIFPLLLVIGMFLWGAKVFFAYATPPPDALEVFATGRRWMWKIQHPTGQREINELHIPVGQPIKVNLTSMDVIHSFYIPAFRVKSDVIPGRDMTLWFEATRPGKYHLYCAEYCGTEHSLMGGWVYAMDPADYEAWLRSGNAVETMVQAGERLFRQYGCSGCHSGNSSVRAPQLEGIYGKPVPLKDGTTVIADDLYLRDSILMPRKEIAGGYDPLMPTFQGQINEEDLVQIVYYIKSLR